MVENCTRGHSEGRKRSSPECEWVEEARLCFFYQSSSILDNGRKMTFLIVPEENWRIGAPPSFQLRIWTELLLKPTARLWGPPSFNCWKIQYSFNESGFWSYKWRLTWRNLTSKTQWLNLGNLWTVFITMSVILKLLSVLHLLGWSKVVGLLRISPLVSSHLENFATRDKTTSFFSPWMAKVKFVVFLQSEVSSLE